jgi:hypothetical protein
MPRAALLPREICGILLSEVSNFALSRVPASSFYPYHPQVGGASESGSRILHLGSPQLSQRSRP